MEGVTITLPAWQIEYILEMLDDRAGDSETAAAIYEVLSEALKEVRS